MHIKWQERRNEDECGRFCGKRKTQSIQHNGSRTFSVVMDIRKEKIRDAVQTFQSLEHRMETVATIKGVEFINDSKATNTNSTWYALESYDKADHSDSWGRR